MIKLKLRQTDWQKEIDDESDNLKRCLTFMKFSLGSSFEYFEEKVLKAKNRLRYFKLMQDQYIKSRPKQQETK